MPAEQDLTLNDLSVLAERRDLDGQATNERASTGPLTPELGGLTLELPGLTPDLTPDPAKLFKPTPHSEPSA